MNCRNIFQYMLASVMAIGLAGCATSSLPPEQQKNYAFVESRVNQYGGDYDDGNAVPCPPCADQAPIGWIDGKTRAISRVAVDLPPGTYSLQVGLMCGNTATCRPSSAYNMTVEAGKRYVLKPNGKVYVSDRFSDRSHEVLYQP